jgi:hypothetical protein
MVFVPAIAKKDAFADGEFFEPGCFFVEFANEFFSDGKAIPGQANCGCHDLCELHGAVSFEYQFQAGDGPGNGYRAVAKGAGVANKFAIQDVHVAGGFGGRNFAIVKEIGFAIGESYQHKPAAADVSGRGLNDSEREGHSYGGIHGIATLFQNCYASLRAELFVGRDHGVRAAHRLLRPSVRSVCMFRWVVFKFGSGLSMVASSGEQQEKGQNTTATKNLFSSWDSTARAKILARCAVARSLGLV